MAEEPKVDPEGGSMGFDNEMAEIRESFIVETTEILDLVGRDLLELEKRPGDADLLKRILRGIHTIKGTSSFLGFGQMAELAHSLEDVLIKLRDGELSINSEMMDVIFDTFDFLKVMLSQIENRSEQGVESSAIVQKLQAELQSFVRITTQTKTVVEEKTETTQQMTRSQDRMVDSTIRVDVNRLDSLMNLVGELVLGRNRLAQATQKLQEEFENLAPVRDLSEAGAQIDFITTELQMAVMKTRMVPIARLFDRLPRLVRDLEKETGKKVNIQIYGKETELDKTIVEELTDPMIHIIRNSVDHGIESIDERRNAKKLDQGMIVVSAEQEGNNIAITIEDDGRGMNIDNIRRKAIEKGLITETESQEMSRREALNLILTPGFSTAEKVTNLSGRGVGMDVVRTNIQNLKGLIDIDSEPGRGTIITLRVPLTLAIISGLIVEASGEAYAIPLGSVIEVVRIQASEIDTIRGREVIQLRDTVLPLARMASVFNRSANGRRNDWYYIVIVGWSEQRLGIVVDMLLGQKEVVIKPLGDYLGNVPAIAGCTILGDGRVIMIIDVGQFIKLYADQVSQNGDQHTLAFHRIGHNQEK